MSNMYVNKMLLTHGDFMMVLMENYARCSSLILHL